MEEPKGNKLDTEPATVPVPVLLLLLRGTGTVRYVELRMNTACLRCMSTMVLLSSGKALEHKKYAMFTGPRSQIDGRSFCGQAGMYLVIY